MRSLFVFVPALAIAAGCASAATFDNWMPGEDGGGGTIDPLADGSTVSNPGADGTGLPCAVRDLLVSQCASCHGAVPKNGSKTSLISRAALLAMTAADPSKSEGQASLERMKDSKAPMPPNGLLSAASIAPFETWVKAGMPESTCATTSDAGLDSGPDPYNKPSVCTSGTKWLLGDKGSSSMHPGVACTECHDRKNKGPIYTIGGTLYPTPHEPNDCYGTSTSSSTAKVVVTDANNKETTLSVNSAGNFYTKNSVAFPVRVKVVQGTKVRAMATPVTNGDCNVCHTENGAQSARGRVFLP